MSVGSESGAFECASCIGSAAPVSDAFPSSVLGPAPRSRFRPEPVVRKERPATLVLLLIRTRERYLGTRSSTKTRRCAERALERVTFYNERTNNPWRKRVTNLARRLVGENAVNTFTQNCDKTLKQWMPLLAETTLPSDITSSDPCIIAAFQAVDAVICGQGSDLLRRLAYIQLNRLFVSLEAIIKFDRENWRHPRKPCCRDATVAIDIYMAAQPGHLDTSDLRRKLKERKRRARIWSELARPSPLMVLLYSGETEPMMYVFPFFSRI
ncbi:hypothetical protein VTK26DRAFT_6732 [Humicola hyalothermophila]